MKDNLDFLFLLALLVSFGLWQLDRANDAVAESVRQKTQLEVQAEAIKTLEKLGEKIDNALEARRGEGEKIQDERQQARQNTRETARKDPTLQNQLDTPLHPALRNGGGLLGRHGGKRANGAANAPRANGGP